MAKQNKFLGILILVFICFTAVWLVFEILFPDPSPCTLCDKISSISKSSKANTNSGPVSNSWDREKAMIPYEIEKVRNLSRQINSSLIFENQPKYRFELQWDPSSGENKTLIVYTDFFIKTNLSKDWQIVNYSTSMFICKKDEKTQKLYCASEIYLNILSNQNNTGGIEYFYLQKLTFDAKNKDVTNVKDLENIKLETLTVYNIEELKKLRLTNDIRTLVYLQTR